ncbi:2-hydroxymuconic semialdehyde hydrolase [Caballeronia sordidicola]|uniref:2-hydroxymuconic semialdehyde hydrolase n=2 Tax=Caballeronia sordidicola TaxID=196367 RepID=A0A242MZ82_CABSO|nr:2-hydroxymuconic semialdehyde hydrolase [Caballeronia sordidicola]
MLHGTAGSLEAFCANLGEHSKHFNCYAIDLIGTGLTDKPDEDYEINDYVEHVRGFMEVMGIQKASLIGISLGTWIAARFALTHPDMVDKLTFNAPFGFADDAEEMAGIRTRRGRAFDDPSWENVKTIFDNLIYLPAKRIPDLIGMRQAMYQEPGARAGADHILNLFKPESLSRNLIPAAEWQKIVAPTLIVLSLKDRPLFVNTARNLINLIPNAQLLEMDDVGHWPQFENSALFNDANIRFLRGQ